MALFRRSSADPTDPAPVEPPATRGGATAVGKDQPPPPRRGSRAAGRGGASAITPGRPTPDRPQTRTASSATGAGKTGTGKAGAVTTGTGKAGAGTTGTGKAGTGKKDRPAATQPEPAPARGAAGVPGTVKKDRPTPSRREAEAARRQRLHQNLSAKESRRLTSQQNRASRMKVMTAREAVPEKTLLRDYVDARFSLGEFLLPSLVVILAASFLGTAIPSITALMTIVMYVFILAVLFDCYLLWRGFKRVLAERLPGTPTRGLLMYAVNRAIQIRRFRLPAPRLKRGDRY